MSEQSYNKAFSVAVHPEAVYRAITREVNKWWTIQASEAADVGDLLTVRFGDPYFMSMEVEKTDPDELLVWKVVAAHMFVEGAGTGNTEWIGTRIRWNISGTENGSEVSLLHEGLVPSFECYATCKNGWDYFLVSLKRFLETGTGSPFTEE